MAKVKTVYRCSECGAEAPKWVGQCPDCGAWNSLVEGVAAAGSRGRPLQAGGYAGALAPEQAVKSLAEVEPSPDIRVPCGLGELDRVLGGGLVRVRWC